MGDICFSLTANIINLEHWAEAEKKAKGYMLCQGGMSEPDFLAYTEKVTVGEPVLRIGGFDILKSQYEALRSFARANDLPLAKVLKSMSAQNGQVVWLHLEGIKVLDISALSRLIGLKGLNLNGSQVVDIRPLAGLKSLQKLELRGTMVNDISPLAGLKQLRDLNLSFTKVEDITPILGHTKITFGNFRGTKVPYEQVEKLKQANKGNKGAEFWAASPLQPSVIPPARVAVVPQPKTK